MGVRPTPLGPHRDGQHPHQHHRLGQWPRVLLRAKGMQDPPQQWQFKRKLWLSQEGMLHSGPHNSTLSLTCHTAPHGIDVSLDWEELVPSSKPYSPSEGTLRQSMTTRPKAASPAQKTSLHSLLSIKCKPQKTRKPGIKLYFIKKDTTFLSLKECCRLACVYGFIFLLVSEMCISYTGVGQRGFSY